MNCADCGRPIRPTEERDGIEKHDGRYEFEYVHDDGNPVCDGTFAARPRTTLLTDYDLQLISSARRIGAELRRRDGDLDRLAGALLAELADRLGGQEK